MQKAYALSTFTLAVALFTLLSVQGDSLAAEVLSQYGPFAVVLYLLHRKVDELEEEVKKNTVAVAEELAKNDNQE